MLAKRPQWDVLVGCAGGMGFGAVCAGPAPSKGPG